MLLRYLSLKFLTVAYKFSQILRILSEIDQRKDLRKDKLAKINVFFL